MDEIPEPRAFLKIYAYNWLNSYAYGFVSERLENQRLD